METVAAMFLEEFKQRVVARVSSETAIRSGQKGVFVFINAHDDDLMLADAISEVIEKHDMASAFPQNQVDVLQELERYLEHCDGVIVVYGNVNAAWVQSQVICCNSMMYRRETPVKALLAVCDGPSEKEKEVLHIRFPRVKIITCRQGVCAEPFQPFLAALGSGGQV
jgi:hypothetical protein